ncbi:exported hypothetical protein [Verrucomicrobia bacterium]|nr:exported hypothetical protein [Verrucomicrobiota bacterium]
MNKNLLGAWWLATSLAAARGQGELVQPEAVPSHVLGGNRTVRVYLPPSYQKPPERRFPVLYLHDGQNVFSSAGTNAGFGWGNWELDRTVDKLSAAGRMQEIIMVAVDNSPARMEEYSGRLDSTKGSAQTNSTAANSPFANYATFLITELKPRIDRQYRTEPGAAHTGVMGSSLGGICSLALAWEHPEVFGRAGSLSGAFQAQSVNFSPAVLAPYHGKPKPIRIYLDSGSRDFTGGDDGRALTARAAEELHRIGWGKELFYYLDAKPLTLEELAKTGLRQDKWPEAQTSQHNEFYWRLRAWRALTFLFPAGDL